MQAIILLSGGIDSTVVLALALEAKRSVTALSFDYGQRHRKELEHAKQIARYFKVDHRIIKIDPAIFAKTSLVGSMDVPKDRNLETIANSGIPSTYVPARNTLFLAYAIGQAEIFEAQEIYAGPNLLDRNPYPDCRPEYYEAFQRVIDLATKQAVEGRAPKLITPLIDLDKASIVQEGKRLHVPFEMTFSCYSPTVRGEPCKRCDACLIREEALSNNKL